MKQRVQIARALSTDPEILLMDEPFGALDAQSRGILQAELERIWLETHKTIVFVTHDVTEAVRLADRIVVFSAGPKAEVIETILVDLERPRLPTSVEVARLAQEVEQLLHLQPSALRPEGSRS
jgi:NitT/TauT family transport system ATP-binding protein